MNSFDFTFRQLFKILQVLCLMGFSIWIASIIYFKNKNADSFEEKEPTFICGNAIEPYRRTPSIENIDSSFANIDLSKGKELFEGNCVACHAIEKDKVGPALMGISKRRNLKWIRSFVRNSQKKIKSGDPYAVALYNKYNKTEMTAFTNFTDAEIDAIVKYVDNLVVY